MGTDKDSGNYTAGRRSDSTTNHNMMMTTESQIPVPSSNSSNLSGNDNNNNSHTNNQNTTSRGRTMSRVLGDHNSSSNNTTKSSGLHHRRVARSNSNDGIDEYERGYGGTSNANANSSAFQQKYAAKNRFMKGQSQQQQQQSSSSRRGNQNRIVFGQWVRTCVLAGIPAYLILLVLFLHRMNQQYQPPQLEFDGMMKYPSQQNNRYTKQQQSLLQQQQQQQHSTKNTYVHPQHYYSADTPYIRTLHAQAQTERKSRYVLESNEESRMVTYQNVNHQKAIQRRTRTVPPPLSSVHLVETRILSSMEWERPNTRYNMNSETIRTTLIKPSMVEEICGEHAKSVVTEEMKVDERIDRPSSYTYRDALQMPKTRTTRVLITGILTQPAYLLALALKETCNVDVVIGFDAMYPNSIRNRLRIQEQMAVLTKMIPKLVRPIFVSHIGIDPLKHAKSFQSLYETSEIDVVASLTPTHIVHFVAHEPNVFRYQSDPEWKNTYSPYIKERLNHPDHSRMTTDANYNTALYSIRTGLLSMEQILASIAITPLNDRPHFLYASASTIGYSSNTATLSHHENVMHTIGRQMDEVLADYYYQQHGVTSIGLRLPNGVYGPWSHPESDLYQLFDQAIRNVTTPTTSADMMYSSMTTTATVEASTIQTAIVEAALARPDSNQIDFLHIHDVVDATIAAMQYRPIDGKSVLFDLQSGETMSLRQLQNTVHEILDPSSTASSVRIETEKSNIPELETHRQYLQKALGWKPRIPLLEGLTRTVAWHMDRVHPYGPPLHPSFNITIPKQIEVGDALLQRHSISTCSASDYVCHGSQPFLPCASECSTRDQCIPTVFDELVTMVQDLTEECDIVLYTNNFDKDATDLTLQSEYLEGSKPQICNLAFVRGGTELVENVIIKVPDSELGRLGVDMSPENVNQPEALKAQKHDKLNGRLLYRGWILIWTHNAPETLSTAEKFLLKLSPGKLFHSDVKSAVFIHQSFGVSPRADDVLFLVHEMRRDPWKARIIKRKTRPKAKFLIPSEPQRKAIILMSELKKQDSSASERLAPEERITTYEATRFMRFSNGEEPMGKEPPEIKLQREFYDRVRASINPDHARGPSDPLHRFELSHWVRSKWVAHDMLHEESRQLRCDWYQEHVLWGSDLDQLSFAYVMQKLELDRKLAHNEPDETAQKQLQERTEMKKLLSDTFEWHALKLPQNKLYSQYELMQILPFDMDNTDERELLHKVAEVKEDGPDMPLYVRIISDRIMAYARKSWSHQKGVPDESDKSEL